jgi:hypothetical protein
MLAGAGLLPSTFKIPKTVDDVVNLGLTDDAARDVLTSIGELARMIRDGDGETTDEFADSIYREYFSGNSAANST